MTDAQLDALKKDCKKFFDFVYDNRIGNGIGEGYLYRGRGLHQLTGKENYSKYSQYAGVDLVKNPDAVIRPEVAIPVAVAYFANNIKRGDSAYFVPRYGKTSKSVDDLTTAVKIAFNANAGLGNNINSAYWQSLDGYQKSQSRAKEMLAYLQEKKNSLSSTKPFQFSSILLILIVLGTLYYSRKK